MKNQHISQIALFASLIAALGLLPSIVIPIANGVPITAQTLGVMLAGVILGARNGALAVILFLVLTIFGGLQLLAGGRGGLSLLYGPSIGFLIGWPIAAAVCGLMMKLLAKRTIFPATIISAFVGGILTLYPIGIIGIALVTKISFFQAAISVAAFVPGDLIKMLICGFVAQAVHRGAPQLIFSR